MTIFQRPSYRDYVISQSLIDDIRNYIGDTPERNRIIDGTEVSDSQIRLAAQLFLSAFNAAPPKLDGNYTADNFPDFMLLFRGVIVELLRMAGLLEARNSVDYQDAGLSISTGSKAVAYAQMAAEMQSEVLRQIDEKRQALNAEEAYAMMHSPENQWWWGSDY